MLYVLRQRDLGGGGVLYEAAAEISLCGGRSDHRGHLKVEPHTVVNYSPARKHTHLLPLQHVHTQPWK